MQHVGWSIPQGPWHFESGQVYLEKGAYIHAFYNKKRTDHMLESEEIKGSPFHTTSFELGKNFPCVGLAEKCEEKCTTSTFYHDVNSGAGRGYFLDTFNGNLVGNKQVYQEGEGKGLQAGDEITMCFVPSLHSNNHACLRFSTNGRPLAEIDGIEWKGKNLVFAIMGAKNV